MTQEEFIEYRNKLIKTLKENICLISFTKTNGEIREMLCTNNSSYTPKKVMLEGQVIKPRKENESVIPTFDLNKKEYRSFKIQNLLDIKILSQKEFENYGQATN
jgi:hypothetical protein